MKKLSMVLLFALVTMVSFGQIQPQQKTETKFDQFVSKSGKILTFTDYTTSQLKCKYSMLYSVSSLIRKVNYAGETETRLYLLITNSSNDRTSSTSSAMIEYSDLVDILKAVSVLKQKEVTDLSSSNYVESKFITSDGFKIGYYISNGKSTWYIDLEKYGSTKTIYPNGTSDEIEQFFSTAKTNMEELKK